MAAEATDGGSRVVARPSGEPRAVGRRQLQRGAGAAGAVSPPRVVGAVIRGGRRSRRTRRGGARVSTRSRSCRTGDRRAVLLRERRGMVPVDAKKNRSAV